MSQFDLISITRPGYLYSLIIIVLTVMRNRHRAEEKYTHHLSTNIKTCMMLQRKDTGPVKIEYLDFKTHDCQPKPLIVDRKQDSELGTFGKFKERLIGIGGQIEASKVMLILLGDSRLRRQRTVLHGSSCPVTGIHCHVIPIWACLVVSQL